MNSENFPIKFVIGKGGIYLGRQYNFGKKW